MFQVGSSDLHAAWADADPMALYLQTRGDGTRHVMASDGGSYGAYDFYRDGSIAGRFANRLDLTAIQFVNGARYQATSIDPANGADIGRIHHQNPGVELRHGLSTGYAACDTTLLFLMDAERLARSPRYRQLVERYRPNVELALSHVLSRIEDNLYWERPPQGADGFGVYVTIWRDSILPNVSGKVEPKYPVVYPLAHFMAARSLLSASHVLQKPELAVLADAMYRTGIKEFIRPDGFVMYRDQEDELVLPVADELQALAYIPRRYTHLLPKGDILRRAVHLATPLGFICTSPTVAQQLSDQYHADAVWPNVQAEAHEGAVIHGLQYVASVAGRIANAGSGSQELFYARRLAGDKMYFYPGGNVQQAWATAASLYFRRVVSLPYLSSNNGRKSDLADRIAA